MAVNPVNGKVYVANTEALNHERFEGWLFAGSSLRGHMSESRITVLSGGGVEPRHLNKHIDYTTCCAPVPNAESEKSLSTPLGMAVSRDGSNLYVAALGSSKVGVFNTAALEADTFVPSAADQIPVSGGGPTGLVLDEPRHRLYVLTRFDDAISVIDTLAKARSRMSRCTIRSRRASLWGAASSMTRASPRATATRRARAATSSATRTASRGTSATRTPRRRRTRGRSPSSSRLCLLPSRSSPSRDR